MRVHTSPAAPGATRMNTRAIPARSGRGRPNRRPNVAKARPIQFASKRPSPANAASIAAPPKRAATAWGRRAQAPAPTSPSRFFALAPPLGPPASSPAAPAVRVSAPAEPCPTVRAGEDAGGPRKIAWPIFPLRFLEFLKIQKHQQNKTALHAHEL